MQDLKARYDKVADFAECELIASVAANAEKRQMFETWLINTRAHG